MPKKIIFHSAVHQFLHCARHVVAAEKAASPANYQRWHDFVESLNFNYLGDGLIEADWAKPQPGRGQFSIKAATFYYRGDTSDFSRVQAEKALQYGPDSIQAGNETFFLKTVKDLAANAGLKTSGPDGANLAGLDIERHNAEEHFHDEWASAEDIKSIDVRLMNEACTAPEMRYITETLGDLHGKTLLDIGCGLGEASVYFAMRGAEVTASDLSQGMLEATLKLAEHNHVKVKVHKSTAEALGLPQDMLFDVIYAGNVLHHVEVDAALRQIHRHLKPDGVLVTWDPVAYNPIINVYRAIAKKVRTEDEHPLRLCDLEVFNKYFGDVKRKWFWFTTLIIFMIMAVIQRRNPNKERYWKKVVEESKKWEWLHTPLEKFDRAVLAVLPFLRPLCWNVAVVARKPKSTPPASGKNA